METPYTEVICTDNAYEGIYQLAKNTFTAVIIEASLIEKYGNEFVNALQSISQQTIFIFSHKVGNENKLPSDEFANKHTDREIKHSLTLAQKLICSDTNPAPPGDYSYTLAFGNDLIIEPERRQVYLKGKKLNLTRKEYDMLFCLASNAGKILSREQIYAQVWEEDNSFNVDDLVKTHIKTLRKKLADADIQYIKNVWGVGYRFEHETEEDGE